MIRNIRPHDPPFKKSHVLLWRNVDQIDKNNDISYRTNPGLFFVYFRLFKQTLQFLQQMNVKKCPSSIRRWDLNPQPFEHESPPITTRPGLPPTRPRIMLLVIGP